MDKSFGKNLTGTFTEFTVVRLFLTIPIPVFWKKIAKSLETTMKLVSVTEQRAVFIYCQKCDILAKDMFSGISARKMHREGRLQT